MLILVAVMLAVPIGYRALTGNDTPTKAEPAAYTQHVVEQAIERYQEDGLELTIAYHNTATICWRLPRTVTGSPTSS